MSRPARALLLLAAAFACLPPAAAEIDDKARFNASGAPTPGVRWMSGGIGDEARDEMRQAVAAYNLLIVFSDRRGSYLAGIPFAVSSRNGREIVSGVSDGPLLYLGLPPAVYRVAAEIDGVWQSRQVRVGADGRQSRLGFVSRGE